MLSNTHILEDGLIEGRQLVPSSVKVETGRMFGSGAASSSRCGY
jgi:hypothetical protein